MRKKTIKIKQIIRTKKNVQMIYYNNNTQIVISDH